MARNDTLLLLDMLIAAQKILRFSEGLSRETIENNEMAASAIMREFQVLGEAARIVSEDGKNNYSQVPWKAISGMRNKLIHEYFNIDFDILWETIQKDIPSLISQLEALVPPDDDEDNNENA